MSSRIDRDFTAYERRLARERAFVPSVLVSAVVAWIVVIFVLLVACGTSPVGTVTSVDRLPGGTYQLEVIARPAENSRDRAYELVDAGRETGCQVGEVWPSCD